MQLQNFYPIVVTDKLVECRDFYVRFFDLEALLHPERKEACRLVGGIGETGPGEDGECLRTRGRAEPRAQHHGQACEAVTAEADRDIVGRAEAREDLGDLEGAREPGAGEVMAIAAGELAAIEDDPPGVGPVSYTHLTLPTN